MRKLLFLLFLFGSGLTASSQSTLASMNGTVRDPSGAVVPGAQVVLHRAESSTERAVVAGADGGYDALNLEPGTYSLRVSAAGFTAAKADNIRLEARQALRFDVALTVSGSETVTVNATDAGAINTDNASISASLSPEAVLDLPANYRGAGSTSPLSVVQALPGVQPDSAPYPPQPSTHPAPSLKFSIQGGLPSQSETTVDGISAQNQTSNNIQGDAFPSANAVAEIRVDGVGNNAEYGQPGEITTVTKSGSNTLHGTVYEYLQNQFLDATPYGTDRANKPHKVANDFGASLGGPVVFPRLYNGRNRTFFFGDYEGLRYPQSYVLQARVPTALMKQGNFSQETTQALVNPFNGGTYTGNTVPINATSAAFLQFFPDPSPQFAGESLNSAIANTGYNYLGTRRDDIASDQFDVRGDQNFGQRAFLFARYTFKNINQIQPADLTLPNSTAYARYRIFATAFNYNFSAKVINEFRFGFTLESDGNSNPFNGQSFLAATALQGVSAPFFNGLPHVGFDNSLNSIGERLGYGEQSKIYQYVDNLTLQVGGHAIRVGADLRRLTAYTEAGGSTPSINYGNAYFTNGNSATGQEFADFLVGVPYYTQTDTIGSDNQGQANSYAFYAQDNWRATPRLNVTYGLRYEYHPAFMATNGLVGNFDPSVPLSGRLIYQQGYANTLSTEELANVNACATPGVNNPYATNAVVNGAPCTPVVSNTQLGLPAGLRTSPTLRFMPRVGFSYRPFGNDRTAIRAGAGYYNITTTGALFYAITQTLQSNFQTFYNTYSAKGPTFAFPSIAPNVNSFTPNYGSLYFYSAVDTHWHDPYSLQTSMSVDHDFGHNIGARVSYVGLHTWHLVWQPNFNQLPRSTTTIAANQPRTAYPFPNFLAITDRNTEAEADYHSAQVEISRRLSGGVSFDSTYTLAKNLSDNQGSVGAFSSGVFVDEQGGYSPTDSFNRHSDYGNVSGTRRNRWLSTAIVELPVGRGRRFGAGLNRVGDLLVGGWQLSNIFLWQSGTFLSATLPYYDIDPSGTGSGPIGGANQRPDRVAKGNNPAHDRNHWFNNNAFACPGQVGYASLAPDPTTGLTPCTVGVGSAPIGRFGTESVGDLTGPGSVSLSSGLSKNFAVTERVKVRAEGTFTNVLNHTNLADPQTDISQANFGQITQSRGSDFGGNRTGQLSLSVEF